jgi:dipeptidase E
MHPRVIAAGGGGAADSRPLDERFAAWTGSGGRMLYWPMALPDDHPLRAGCLDWINSVFRPLGIDRIEMWTEFHGHDPAELERFDSFYIGGGNTYRLLHLLRKALLGCILSGKAVYGGSAGAAILGRDIGTVSHMDHNAVGLKDMHGLDVMQGYAIWCHYGPEDDARIAAYIEDTGVPVLAISERAGVALEDGRLVALGYEPVMRFSQVEGTVVDVGTEV